MAPTESESPLAADALEGRLESLVDRVLTVRRSVEAPARALAGLPGTHQGRFLDSVEFIATTSVELAYNFCMFAVPALDVIGEAQWQDWVLHLMDIYDESGVLQCIVAMQKVKEYAAVHRHSDTAIPFEEVARVLQPFVCGLNGRGLRLATGEHTYTDTETIYLPACVDRFRRREDNYRLYKAMAVHLWAQAWFGTWRAGIGGLVGAYPQPAKATHLLHVLETLRLDACLARELPGIHRELQQLGTAGDGCPDTAPWQMARRRLEVPGASVRDSAELLARLYDEGLVPDAVSYQGVLLPEQTEAAMALRQRREAQVLGEALALVAEEHALGRAGAEPDGDVDTQRFETRKIPDGEWPEGFRVELHLAGEPVLPPQDVQQLMESMVQDFGDVPDEYLEAAGHGRYRADRGRGAREGAAPDVDDGAHVYDEWDYIRQHYRKEWCLVRERDVRPVRDDFVRQTLEKYRGLLKHLYRTFEALRGEDRKTKRQPFGDDIDIDAVVESYVDRRAGLEISDRLFTRRRRDERNIAVMFMVDMSGSTKGWINDVEREALVLLCEALEILGDRYAIYGFSGFTHKRCELLRIKRFGEPYNDQVRARISGIRPQDYTRMGGAIRHLSRVLDRLEARTKLLITLSDGRPDDQDGYRGAYGIEDTRQALLEARYRGIHPFCITIDDEALEYLPHMYGPAAFTLVSQVDRLPYKVSDIYRRITL